MCGVYESHLYIATHHVLDIFGTYYNNTTIIVYLFVNRRGQNDKHSTLIK